MASMAGAHASASHTSQAPRSGMYLFVGLHSFVVTVTFRETYPLFYANKPITTQGEHRLPVYNKATGKVLASFNLFISLTRCTDSYTRKYC